MKKATLTHRGLVLMTPLLCLFMMFQTAIAQQTITGMVTHATSGIPLTGVSIQVKGKVIGTTTGSDGRFTLTINDVPPFELLITSIGVSAQERVVTDVSMPL